MLEKIIENKVSIIIACTVILVTTIIMVIILNIPKLNTETFAEIIEQNITKNIENEPIIIEIDDENIEIIDENWIIENGGEVDEKSSSTILTNNSSTIISYTPYYIKVNLSANVVTVYKKDENNEYTIPIKAMLCSTGTYTPPCAKYPNTKYKTTGARKRWNYLQGNVWGQYSTHIVGNILFHSVPYLSQSENTLEYWEYDLLGTSASAGCIRLAVKDAKWIYDNISAGTIVEFYSDSNPGELGRPSSNKISSYPDYLRNWDPTDPNESNPWITYTEEPIETTQNGNTSETNENTIINNNQEQNNNAQNDIINSNSNFIEENTILSDIENEVINTDTNTENNEI